MLVLVLVLERAITVVLVLVLVLVLERAITVVLERAIKVVLVRAITQPASSTSTSRSWIGAWHQIALEQIPPRTIIASNGPDHTAFKVWNTMPLSNFGKK